MQMNHGTLDQLVATARRLFHERLGHQPDRVIVAPGRVNLIGEHVDYNDGFVLPMAIERYIVIAAARHPEPVARIHSVHKPELVEIDLRSRPTPAQPAWANYIRGVIAGFQERHPHIPGFDAEVVANLPEGGGLSSSAALEVSTCLLVESVTGHPLDALDRIRLCQHAEHAFAGVPCGIMDQFIVAAGQAGHALLLDCRSLETRQVPLPDDQVALIVTHSGVAHELGKGEYGKRRADCQRAAEQLRVSSLREATLAQVQASHLPPLERRRARHVVTEIQRTLEFVEALGQRQWAEAGELMYASHQSLRDDYEVSCPELDQLVDIARALGPHHGVWGARMTGGGFGGCTVTLVRADAADAVQQAMLRAYERRTGIRPSMFVSRPAAGARVLEA